MKQIVRTIGLDLAKNSFCVHCADADGRCIEDMAFRWVQVVAYFERQPPSKVAMETYTELTGGVGGCKTRDTMPVTSPPISPSRSSRAKRTTRWTPEAICEAEERGYGMTD